MWGFCLFLCLHCGLGGLGVQEQGDGSNLRDPKVQVFFFSFLFWDWVFRTNMRLLHSVWKDPLHCRKVEKRFRILFSLCMQSAWYVEMEFIHTHTHIAHGCLDTRTQERIVTRKTNKNHKSMCAQIHLVIHHIPSNLPKRAKPNFRDLFLPSNYIQPRV